MGNAELDESVVRVDRLSKVGALLFAAAMFVVASILTADAQFSMIVAAFAGIGLRFYIPYHASISDAVPEMEPLDTYEATGNYHHGAAGVALVVATAVAVIVMVVELDSTPALGVGGVVGVVCFPILHRMLPS
jgi:hypothetical protein